MASTGTSTYKVICTLTIKHYNSFTTSSKISDLVIKSAETTQKMKDSDITTEAEKEGLSIEMNFSMGDICFEKKIYQPHEIKVTVCIQPESGKDLPDLETIKKMFLNKLVNLEISVMEGEKVKAIITETNCYIADIKPRYSKSSYSTEVKVDLNIKSLDNLMALNKYSQAYLARKFSGEILASVDRFKLSYPYSNQSGTSLANLPDDIRQNLTLRIDNDRYDGAIYTGEGLIYSLKSRELQNLFYDKKEVETQRTTEKKFKDGKILTLKYTEWHQKEFIQPYLVQYNESFYDFIVRIANRCGEFLYFEDGKLCVGLPMWVDKTSKSTSTVDCTSLSATDYSEVIFHSISDASPLDVKDFMRDSLKDNFTGFATKTKDGEEKEDTATTNFPNIAPSENAGQRIYKDFGRKEDLKFPGDTELGKYPETGKPYDDYYYNSEVAVDEYYMPLYKDGFGAEAFSDKMSEVSRGTPEKHKAYVVGKVLAATNLIDLILDLGAEYIELALITLNYKNTKNDRGRERFIEPYSPTVNSNETGGDSFNKDVDHVVPFSEDVKERWTTLSYYSDIRKNQEEQQRQMIEINFDVSTIRNIKLGEIIKLTSISSSTLYVVTEVSIEQGSKNEDEDSSKEDTPNIIQKVKAIPLRLNGKEYSAYPPVIKKEVFRFSGAQTAFVVDAADPKHQGRVRIRYPWQTNAKVIPDEIITPATDSSNSSKINEILKNYYKEKTEAATPWIRMAVPSSSNSGGIYFEPEPGDEVIVDFENGNVERPYVIGALYSKNNTAPVGKGRRVIKSKFGHTLRFKDPSDGVGEITDSIGKQRVLGQLSPITDMLSLWNGSDVMNKPVKEKVTVKNENGEEKTIEIEKEDHSWDPLTGGIDMGDAYGIYNISMSSDERAIKISSPFGDVKLNAFTGISITAPNGNIKISGKNIDIEASNKVNITSGTNLERGTYLKNVSGLESGKDLLPKVFEQFTDRYAFINLGLIRSVIEIIVRPIDGTLKLKSHGFLKIEAGEGESEVPKDNYRPFYKNLWMKKKYADDISPEEIVDCFAILNGYIKTVKDISYIKANKEIRNSINTARFNILEFSNKYIKTNRLINIKNIDALIDFMYSATFAELKVKDINPIRIKGKYLQKQQTTNTLRDINKQLRKLWDIINTPTGLKAISNVDVFTSINGFVNNQNIITYLKNDITHLYNKGDFVFEKIKKLQNADTAKEILNPTKSIGTETEWDDESRSMSRTLLSSILTPQFFGTNFPDLQLTYTPAADPKDTQQWHQSLTTLQITVIPLPASKALAALNYLADNFFSNLKDFFGGMLMWKDGYSVKGKILMSEKKGTTIRLNDKGAMVQQPNREQEIENTVSESTNQLRAALNF